MLEPNEDRNRVLSSSSSRARPQSWQQSTASLCSSGSRKSGGSGALHHRLQRNVHLKKGSNSNSRLQLYQQLQQHASHDVHYRHHQNQNSSALATFQARLCLGTEYLPVYELSGGDYQPRPVTSTTTTTSSSTSTSTSSLQQQPQQKPISTVKKKKKTKRKLDTLERMVKQKQATRKKKKRTIKRLTFLRLTSRGIVFSDVPSIKLVDDEDIAAIAPQDSARPFSPFRKLVTTTSPKPSTPVQRTPSVQRATIAWADLDHIWLQKRRMDLHIKPQAQQQKEKQQLKSSESAALSVLHLKFAATRDVHAFITAGLAYGYFRSKDLVFSGKSVAAAADDDDDDDDDEEQPCTSSTPSSSSAAATAEDHLAAASTKKQRSLLATLWNRLKSSNGKAKDISISSNSSRTSSISSSADGGFPDSTTTEKEKEVEGGQKGAGRNLRRHLSTSAGACVRWASRHLRAGRRQEYSPAPS
ncbi:hypothetical protein TYRP_014752 [Tyrophagus putrescentiae]|nr:hypothetical protein TYRP_014752 [Tyrophagus putrescentiae]